MSESGTFIDEKSTPPAERWDLQSPFSTWTVLVVAIAIICLSFSADRIRLDTFLGQLSEFAQATIGIRDSSQIGGAIDHIATGMFPIELARQTPVARIEGFDAESLPLFAHLEERTVEERTLNPETLEFEIQETTEVYLVKPIGYLTFVLGKMIETIEIAIWASLLAVLISLPLAVFSARPYTPHFSIYVTARGLVSLLRAIPELISALFLVLAVGFGPVAGVLALGLHSAGFLGKFYAEDIEAADDQPQEALRAIGATPLKVLRLSVLPQVLPSYTALTLYILDRNIRMATVVGLVGAGGIGQELKGRYDQFEYDHVGTILLIIFVTVFLLDQMSARIRRQLI